LNYASGSSGLVELALKEAWRFSTVSNPQSKLPSGAPTALRLGMLRITVVESSGVAARLRVEGRVTDGWVEELRKTCDLQGLDDGIRLTLDLADVTFVDAAGIELLKELKRRRVALLNPTAFVAQQLKNAARSGGARKDCPSLGNRS
jgi:anti-anti-sigma regulatory factor